MTDLELLKQYWQTHSEAAFAELVRRHLDWVYSAAVRQVRDRHLAEDVTQGVFITLARKAKSLGRDEPLSPWLLRVTRCGAISALRAASRRERHEQKAAAMRSESSTTTVEADWAEVVPVLDEGVLRLGRKYREAVVLRFYERKSLREVGEAMGVSEEAARKRVDRGIEKLRGLVGKKVGAASVAGLAAMLGAKGVEAAPVGLGEAAIAAVGNGGAGMGAGGVIAKGVIRMMAWGKVKVAAGIAIVGLMTAGGAAVVVAPHGAGGSPVVTSQPASDPLADPVGPLARPVWPAGGTPELVQVSCVVDARVVAKLRGAGQAIQHECTGYEAIRIDPELALHYLREAKKADLAYLPDDMWYRWNAIVLVPHERMIWTTFHDGLPPGNWRGERLRLDIKQELGKPVVHERDLTAGELRIDLPNVQITLNQKMHPCNLKLRTSMAVGDGVMLMGRIGQVGAGDIWHVILYQAISATPEELANYRDMRDEVAWIENGTAGEQRLVQQAVAWQAKAKASPAQTNERWTRTLPGGTRVEVLAVNDQKLNPYCWWTPDGTPAMPGYRRARVALYAEQDGARTAWTRVSRPTGWFSSSSNDMWFVVKDDGVVQLFEGSGAFTLAASLKPEVGQSGSVEGQPFGIRSLSGSGDSCSVTMEYTFFKDMETRVVAVTEDGKEHDPLNTRLAGSDHTVTVTDWTLSYPVAASKIKEFRIKKRPLYQVRFEGLALKPAEPLPLP